MQNTALKDKLKAPSSKYDTVQHWKKKAWKVFSEWVHRTEAECFTCGVKRDYRELDAGHFIHQRANVYFDERNVHAQCTKCNRFLHGNLGAYADGIIRLYGLGVFRRLIKAGKVVIPWDKEELKQIYQIYSEKLKEIT